MDENEMQSNEKKNNSYSLTIKQKWGLTSSLLLEMFFHLDKQTSVKHLTALKRLCFVVDSYVCVNILTLWTPNYLVTSKCAEQVFGGVFIGKSCNFLNINTVQMFCVRLAIEITVHSSLVA